MTPCLRPHLLEEPVHSCEEYADGALYYFNTSLQLIDPFWNVWSRSAGHIESMSRDSMRGVRRIGVELCHKLEASWENWNPQYVTLPASPYVLCLGSLDPLSRALVTYGSRAHACTDEHAWQRDNFKLLWPDDLREYTMTGGRVAYYADELYGEIVPVLAHYRM